MPGILYTMKCKSCGFSAGVTEGGGDITHWLHTHSASYCKKCNITFELTYNGKRGEYYVSWGERLDPNDPEKRKTISEKKTIPDEKVSTQIVKFKGYDGKLSEDRIKTINKCPLCDSKAFLVHRLVKKCPKCDKESMEATDFIILD